jgi:hypothetical protein
MRDLMNGFNRYVKRPLFYLGAATILTLGAYGLNYAVHKTAAENCQKEIHWKNQWLRNHMNDNEVEVRPVEIYGKTQWESYPETFYQIQDMKAEITFLESELKEHNRKAVNLNPFDYR